MKEQMIHLQIRGEKKDYPLGTTYIELAEEYQQYYEEDIVLVLLNNRRGSYRRQWRPMGWLNLSQQEIGSEKKHIGEVCYC